MPILPAEPDMYPADLWSVASGGHGSGRHWWCLHTKPRQEKSAARHLRNRGLAHYLPQIRRDDRTPKGRKTSSVLPLFSSYLFLLGDDNDRLEAYRGNNLVNILEVKDQGQLEHDLRQIHQLLSSGLPILPEPELPIGSRVRILSGPLVGMEGTIVRWGNRDHFIAVVEFLGRGAKVELQSWQVEPIKP
ncbi:transcription/translation regulatory transformer protein RfaH [soil metagenome]